MPFLVLEGLTKRFGDFTALDDITIEAPDGKLTALLGPSGSGKSTMLQAIGLLEGGFGGRIEIAGIDASKLGKDGRIIFMHVRHEEAGAFAAGADAAATGRALPVRFMLEARHIPVNPLAQVGKGLAQDRLDLESIFPRRDHARRQLQAQADLDALLAPRLRGNDFEPDQILAKARKVRFKLPHLLLDDLRRALLAVPVEIAE